MNAREAGAIKAPVRYGLVSPTGSAAEPASVEDWLATIATNTAAIAANAAAIVALQTPPGAWTAYTPVITTLGGTIGGTSGVSGAYEQYGKTVRFVAEFTFTLGSGTTGLKVTLPVAPKATRTFPADCCNSSAVDHTALISGPNNDARIFTAAGSMPAAGSSFYLGGVYEAA